MAQSGGNSWPGPDGASSSQRLPAYPPPIFGGNDPSASSGDDMSDWFTRWVKPLMQKCCVGKSTCHCQRS